jgi:hypothetical protein
LGLERDGAPRLLSRVTRVDPGAGARAGIVAASAGAGALIAFGLRQGLPARPFNAIGIVLLGDRARGVLGFDPLTSTTGALVFIAFCVVAGVLLSQLVGAVTRRTSGELRPLPAFVLALVVMLCILAIVVRAAPDIVGVQPVAALSVTQGIVVTFLLSVGFVSGMRLAR